MSSVTASSAAAAGGADVSRAEPDEHCRQRGERRQLVLRRRPSGRQVHDDQRAVGWGEVLVVQCGPRQQLVAGQHRRRSTRPARGRQRTNSRIAEVAPSRAEPASSSRSTRRSSLPVSL